MRLLVLLDHLPFVEALNGYRPACFFLLAQADFSEGSPANHANELKALFAHLLPPFSQFLHLLLDDAVFGLFPLLNGKVELFDLLLEGLPTLLPLIFLQFVEVILFFDKAFGLVRLYSCRLAYYYISFHNLSVKFIDKVLTHLCYFQICKKSAFEILWAYHMSS